MGQVYSAQGSRWGMPTICEPGVGPDKDKPIWSVDQTYRDNSGSFHNPMMSFINNMILALPNPLDCEIIEGLRKSAMDRQIHVSWKLSFPSLKSTFRCVWDTVPFR